MPLAFSFFSSKNSTSPSSAGPEFFGAQQVDANVSELKKTAPSSPFPVNAAFSGSHLLPPQEQQPSQEQLLDEETVLLARPEPPPLPLPERRPSTGGLAAMVLSQSDIAAPPLNKRLSSIPGTAVTIESSSLCPPSTPPVPDLDALKQELQTEIEQVKNDLFGAVMGVSALKDRLDGIESQVQQSVAEPALPSRNDLEIWMTTWLEKRLDEVLERTLAPVLNKFSTQGLLRLPLSPAELHSTLSQPPVILTSTPV